MARAPTIAARAQALGHANGFDGFRFVLALGIVAFHCCTLTAGGTAGMSWPIETAARLILPAFFILSGYLVASSLARCGTAREFLLLRLLRIVPALTAVTIASVLLIGPLLTSSDLRAYFSDPRVPGYFQNILGLQRFELPGVFEANPRAAVVNGSLWTIQLEMICYGLLAALSLLSRGRLLDLLLIVWGGLLLFPNIPFVGLALAWLPAKDLVLGFAAGALLYRYARRVPLHPLGGLVSLLLAFCLVRAGGYAVLAVLPLAYGVIWLATRRIPACLTRADYSYGLYLAAYPLQQAVIDLFPGIAWWGVLATALPAALFCAALLWHGVERPLLTRKHEIIARLTGGPAPVRA
jgi:peptidoglycan/LPS O-acetylase OafA/YrhL